MKPLNHDWIQRLVDEEASPDALQNDRERLTQDPEAQAFHDEALELGQLLRATYPQKTEPPHPDFFNHFLMKNIQESERNVFLHAAEAKPVMEREQDTSSWMHLLWHGVFRWVAPMATGAALVMILNRADHGQGEPETTLSSVVQGTYSPAPGVRIQSTMLQNNAGVILTLEGLEEVKSLGHQRMSARTHVETTPQGKTPALLDPSLDATELASRPSRP